MNHLHQSETFMSRKKLSYLSLSLSTMLSATLLAQEDSQTEEIAIENASDDTKSIEKITIQGNKLNQFDDVAGTKDGAPVLESPMSASILTEKRMQMIGAETIQSALGYVSGVYNGPFGNDTRGDWSTIRGVEPVQYLDGLRLLFGNYNNTRPVPYNLQQIEILKGPNAVLYGAGTTGGVVNMVSKIPQPNHKNEVWLQSGTYNRQQLSVDLGGITTAANLSYRVLGQVRESDSQTDFVKDNNYQITPSITWEPTDDTSITLLVNGQRTETGSSVQFFPLQGSAIDSPNGQFPSERFVSEPGWDRYNANQRALTTLIDHTINDDWLVAAAARYSESEVNYRTMYGWPPVLNPDGETINRLSYESRASANALTADSRVRGFFSTGPIDHKLVVGLDVQRATIDDDNGVGTGGQFNIFNPTYGEIPDPIEIIDNPATTLTQEGLYLQDTLYFGDGWIATGSLRFDQTASKVDGDDEATDSETTSRLALMYVFENGFSSYVSYGQSFDPVIGKDAFGEVLKPKRGEQTEYGIKFQPTGSKHLITANYHEIREENRTGPLPLDSALDPSVVDPGGLVQTGEVEINGIEVEAQLEFTHVDVYANYSTNNSEITETTNPFELGAALSSTPKEMYSIWTSYWPQTLGKGFRVGAGYRFINRTSNGLSQPVTGPDGSILAAPFETEPYDMIDLMAGYQIGQFDVSVNVNNAEDETVSSTCLSRGDCFYAQRRTITSNLRYSF